MSAIRRSVPARVRVGLVLLAAAAAAATTTSCAWHRHTVGLGPGGYGTESVRQFYFLWGLVPINDADERRLVEDLSGYEIVTEWAITDILLAPFLFPVLVTSRTITVRR